MVKIKIKNIFLILLIFFSVSCSRDIFPVKYFYKIDLIKKTCDQFELNDFDSVKFKFVKTLEFEKCPNVFGLEYEETAKLLRWIRREKKRAEDNGL